MSIIYGNMVGGASGTDGKSAYQYAVEGGYTGTEAEFSAKLAEEIPHTLPNPNALTFTGAVTGSYDGSAAVTVEIPSGDSIVPAPSSADDGKILRVVDGSPAWVSIASATGVSF